MVHIIVYAGAIMVLFLFTVMLLNLNIENDFKKPRLIKFAAVISGSIFFLLMIAVLKSYDIAIVQNPALTQIGLVKNLGNVLFKDFLLPFEITSILFLAAMVGAVMIGKKDIY